MCAGRGLLWLLAASWLPLGTAAAATSTVTPGADWAALDTRLERWLGKALLVLPARPQVSTVSALAKTCEGVAADEEPHCAAHIVRHLALVERDVHHRDVPLLLQRLLAWNQRAAADRVYAQLTKYGDKSAAAQAAVSLVEYDFARQRWQDVVRAAETAAAGGGPQELSKLRFLHGVALQELRKHRAALAQYAKVARASPYYPQAQLNMAVANIRQDWWTDGHAIIAELLKDSGRAADPAFNDRLNTVLGFSLVRQQYYRSARDAFRNVGLDGPYTNKALLGILLSAMYQQDYVGALHAAKTLRQAAVRDLPADEAALLMGYIYERLQQPATALAAYAEAVGYYEQRIAALTAARIDENAIRAAVKKGDAALDVAGTPFYFDSIWVPATLANVRALERFRPHAASLQKNRALEAEYAAIDDAYGKLLVAGMQNAVAQYVSHLNHYMSQARFGLAAVHEQAGTEP